MDWEPDYTRPPRPREVVFIGGAADGIRRVVEHARPWLEVIVFKGLPSIAAYTPGKEPSNPVNTSELYSRETYERQGIYCGDEKAEGLEPIILYTLQGMKMREAFTRLFDGYAPRRDLDKVVIR